jgi:hypothetical protein
MENETEKMAVIAACGIVCAGQEGKAEGSFVVS